MPRVTLETVLEEYLRRKTEELSQEKMADLIGTKRQGINAIINRQPGRRFTWDHLNRYVKKVDISASKVLTELTLLAWELEGTAISDRSRLLPPSSLSPGAADLLEVLARLLDDLRARRGQ